MNTEDAAEAILDFLMEYVEKKKGFLGKGVDVDEEDEAALTIANATAWRDQDKITVMFRCASALDYTEPPVTDWIDECMAAVRKARPDATSAAELVVECVRASGPGLEL